MNKAGFLGALIFIVLLALVVGVSVMALNVKPQFKEEVITIPNDNFPK